MAQAPAGTIAVHCPKCNELVDITVTGSIVEKRAAAAVMDISPDLTAMRDHLGACRVVA